MAGGKGIASVNGRGQGLHEGIDQGLDAFEVQGIAHGNAGHGGDGTDVLQMAGFETPQPHRPGPACPRICRPDRGDSKSDRRLASRASVGHFQDRL